MNNLSAEWIVAVSVAVLWQRIDFGEKEGLLDAEWLVRKWLWHQGTGMGWHPYVDGKGCYTGC